MVRTILNGKGYVLLTESEFEKICENTSEKFISREEVAKIWGISPNRLSECPWLLPNREKGKHQQYLTSEILELVKIGKKELKKKWL